MKKTWMLLLALMLVAVTVAGCGGDKKPAEQGNKETPTNSTAPAPADGYADGSYYAEGDFAEKSGWKEVVSIEVKDGKIIDVNWNALHKDGGLDKKVSSETGAYGMVEHGNAQAEWHEQAAKIEQFIVEKQSAADLKLNDEGKTDAVSGVSIGAGEFVQLVDKALKAGPVERGAYKDGHYKAEAAQFDENSGWKETVDVTVISGKIAAVSWNGVHKDGGTDKVTRSKAGEYGMVANGKAQAEWHEQAAKAEQFLLEKQDPAALAVNAEGKTDAVSGVSIHVGSFIELAAKALEGAK